MWKVLAFFLSNPSTSIYVKQLSRDLKISPSGTNKALKFLEKSKILFKEERGKAHYYFLNNELSFIKHLKISYFLAKIQGWKIEQKFKKQDEDLISLAVYGSYASGDFDERSDIDFLLISSKSKEHFLSLIQNVEKFFNREANLEVFNLSKWQKIRKENRIFYDDIIKNHILLAGSELP